MVEGMWLQAERTTRVTSTGLDPGGHDEARELLVHVHPDPPLDTGPQLLLAAIAVAVRRRPRSILSSRHAA